MFIAVGDPVCAVQARAESFQAAVTESVVSGVDRHDDIVHWSLFVVEHSERNDPGSEL